MRILTLAVVLIIAVSNVVAQEFPVEIQNRLDKFELINLGSNALGSSVSGFDGDIGNIHEFLQVDPNVETLWLVEYKLGGNSQSDSFDGTQDLTGSIFLLCKNQFQPTEPKAFTLYLELVSPNVVAGNFIHETVDIEFADTSNLLEGEARYCFEELIDPDFCGPPICDGSPPTLLCENTPIQCIGLCCGITGEIHLPGISYAGDPLTFTQVTEFDFSDNNFSLVYRHTSFSSKGFGEGFFSFQQFEIPLFQKGDVNEDGSVDLLDVAGFVDCLNSGIYDYQCDLDCNQTVNLLDVAPFVDLLND